MNMKKVAENKSLKDAHLPKKINTYIRRQKW